MVGFDDDGNNESMLTATLPVDVEQHVREHPEEIVFEDSLLGLVDDGGNGSIALPTGPDMSAGSVLCPDEVSPYMTDHTVAQLPGVTHEFEQSKSSDCKIDMK